MSLYCVSYARDFPWLLYLFKSTERYCRGFKEFVLAVPETDVDALEAMYPFLAPGGDVAKALGLDMPVHTYIFDESYFHDHHMAAMSARLNADGVCEGDMVLNIDSDCVWIAETTPQLFIHPNNWAINLFTNYRIEPGKPDWPSPWRRSTELALCEPVIAETMRRHPGVFWRDSYESFRKHIEKVHHKTLEEYLRPLKRGEFSEFCSLGYYCMKHEPGYHWIDSESAEKPVSTVHQFWSFNGVNHPEVQAKLRELGLL